jgi:hypothetical protein
MASMHARSLVFFALGLAVAVNSVPLRAQSLATLAKKEEERRKSVPAPAKVYTNKDLTAVPEGTQPSSIPAPAAPDAASAPPAAGGAPKDAEASKPAGQVKDQAYWAGRQKALQEKLEREQTYVEAMQTRVNALSTDFVNRDDPVQRGGIERDRQKVMAEMDRLKKSVEDTKKGIADLEEEARRAGVPPGWLR